MGDVQSSDGQLELVHSYESELRHPVTLVRHMWRDLLASRELAFNLMMRDIQAQYRQSLLGFIWIFFPPIVTALGLTLATRAQIINLGETDLPYPAYVMFSMTLWQTFTESLNAPIRATVSSMQMMTKINFPREAIILAKVGDVLFRFCIKLILIIGLFIWFQMPVTWSALLAPVGLINLILFGLFIGGLLAPLAVLYQDLQKIVGPVIGAWLFVTPVIYSVPEDGWFSTVVALNPVTPLLVTTRELATTGLLTQVMGFWISSAIGLVGLGLAWILFRVALPHVVERMSS